MNNVEYCLTIRNSKTIIILAKKQSNKHQSEISFKETKSLHLHKSLSQLTNNIFTESKVSNITYSYLHCLHCATFFSQRTSKKVNYLLEKYYNDINTGKQLTIYEIIVLANYRI